MILISGFHCIKTLSTFLISPDSLDCLYQLLLAHSGRSNIISMFTIKVI